MARSRQKLRNAFLGSTGFTSRAIPIHPDPRYKQVHIFNAHKINKLRVARTTLRETQPTPATAIMT
jgi:hypothetical protein